MYSKVKETASSTLQTAKNQLGTVSDVMQRGSSFVTDKTMSIIGLSNIFEHRFSYPEEQKEAIRETIKPGDIILAKTPTLFETLSMQQTTSKDYNDIYVVVGSHLNCLQITSPEAKLTKVWNLIYPIKEPKIIRPRVSEEVKDKFIQECYKIVGNQFEDPRLSNKFLEQQNEHHPKPECYRSHAIFEAFSEAHPEIYQHMTCGVDLDLYQTGMLSIQDFNYMADMIPGKFDVIYPLTQFKEKQLISTDITPEIKQSESFMQRYGINKIVDFITSITNNGIINEIILTSIPSLVKPAINSISNQAQNVKKIHTEISNHKDQNLMLHHNKPYTLKQILTTQILKTTNLLKITPNPSNLHKLQNLVRMLINYQRGTKSSRQLKGIFRILVAFLPLGAGFQGVVLRQVLVRLAGSDSMLTSVKRIPEYASSLTGIVTKGAYSSLKSLRAKI
ncbi:unnamed protein product [Moneuplotes crassus]|uniref:Uncharacterized protein n=1 Tax=Euplotes crassus TaxID=5936 RepID=A0AAD1XAT4_EUPCR|nr:unnamed protein product [Moneuplotes crassus]